MIALDVENSWKENLMNRLAQEYLSLEGTRSEEKAVVSLSKEEIEALFDMETVARKYEEEKAEIQQNRLLVKSARVKVDPRSEGNYSERSRSACALFRVTNGTKYDAERVLSDYHYLLENIGRPLTMAKWNGERIEISWKDRDGNWIPVFPEPDLPQAYRKIVVDIVARLHDFPRPQSCFEYLKAEGAKNLPHSWPKT